MMVTTPSGVKVRCESHRRYWVVQQYTTDVVGPSAYVVKRTDSTDVAGQFARRTAGRMIFDSVRKEWL